MEKSSSWLEIQSGFAEKPDHASPEQSAVLDWPGARRKRGSGICKPPATCWFFVTLSRPT